MVSGLVLRNTLLTAAHAPEFRSSRAWTCQLAPGVPSRLTRPGAVVASCNPASAPTVSVAGALNTNPSELLAMTRYCPALVSTTSGSTSVLPVLPGSGSLPLSHWYWIGAELEAETANVAVSPTSTD